MTEPLAQHVTMRLEGGRVLCRSLADRRIASRILYEHGEARGLIVFGNADTHVHVLLACSRAEAGRFARIAETSLRARLGAGVRFERARFTSLWDQAHLVRAFFHILRQERRHGTSCDPFHDGGSLPELIGARLLRTPAGTRRRDAPVLGVATAQRVASMLPRVSRCVLLAEVGLRLRDEPAGGAPSDAAASDAAASDAAASRVERLKLGNEAAATRSWVRDDLREAAAAALGLEGVAGRGVDRTLARHAAVHAAAAICSAEVADVLAISRRAVQQLRARPAPPAAERAVSLQLRMRAALRSAALR